jgi:hypothetical protein
MCQFDDEKNRVRAENDSKLDDLAAQIETLQNSREQSTIQ